MHRLARTLYHRGLWICQQPQRQQKRQFVEKGLVNVNSCSSPHGGLVISRQRNDARKLCSTPTCFGVMSRCLHSTVPLATAWKQVFPPLQYISAWEPHFFSSVSQNYHAPLDDTRLDIASRQMIASLQQLYLTGTANNKNNDNDTMVTQDWCHFMLKQLGQTPTLPQTQRAEILVQLLQRLEAAHAGLSSSSYGIFSSLTLPVPNGRTYRLLLDLYARTPEPSDLSLAHAAKEVVLRMEADYRQGADLDRKATVVDWNMVLQAYANAKHPDRAQHAVSLMSEFMLGDDLVADASSFLFVARACGFKIADPDVGRKGAQLLAQLWERIVTQDERLRAHSVPLFSSHFYSMFLQTIRWLPPSDERERLYQQTFCLARDNGKLNEIIVQEFIVHGKPVTLVEQTIGSELFRSVKGLSASEAARRMLAQMPPEWTAHKDG